MNNKEMISELNRKGIEIFSVYEDGTFETVKNGVHSLKFSSILDAYKYHTTRAIKSNDWEQRALQNFADNFGMEVSKQVSSDHRKKSRWILSINGISISPPRDYNGINDFLLGWDRCVEMLKPNN